MEFWPLFFFESLVFFWVFRIPALIWNGFRLSYFYTEQMLLFLLFVIVAF